MKIILTESQITNLLNELEVHKHFINRRTSRVLDNQPYNMNEDIRQMINKVKNFKLNESVNDVNSLSYEDFDDINSSEWRKLAHKGNYKDAINYMLNYLTTNKENLENYQIGGILWHIGQLYAFDGDYKNAINYMSKQEVSDSIEPNYQKGTISFLSNDLDNLKKFYNELVNNDPSGGSGRDILKSFITNFGEMYKNVY